MSSERLRQSMIALSVVLVSCSAISVWWAISDLPNATPSRSVRRQIASDQPTAEISPELDPRLTLRRPLVDPPAIKAAVSKPPPKRKLPAPKPAPPKPKPTIDLTLVMTVRGPGGNVAVISDGQGNYDSKSAGETLDLKPAGAIVRDVASDHVMVEFDGRQTKLIIDQERDYSAAKPNSNPARGGGRVRAFGPRAGT